MKRVKKLESLRILLELKGESTGLAPKAGGSRYGVEKRGENTKEQRKTAVN